MLLQVLKSDRHTNLILLLIATIFLWGPTWFDPVAFYFYPGESSMPLFHYIDNLFPNKATLTVAILGTLLTFINALLVYVLNSEFLFMKTRTYLPSFLYIIFTSSVREYDTLLPSQFAATLFILGMYYIFKTYQSSRAIGDILIASIILSLASLFYLPSILFLPIIWISVLILRQKFNWRHLVIPIIGVIIPWYICGSIYYLNDHFYSLINILQLNTFSKNLFLSHDAVIYQQGIVVAFFVVWGILSVVKRYGLKKEASRKYLNIMIWTVLCSIAIYFLFATCSYELITITGIPLAYLTAHIFQFSKSNLWFNLLFVLFLLTIIGSPYLHIITF
ncbi:DUF6427 family protein [Halosquirtibacter xylanolyticus]|uniref:DUF6427 family protein n=1 Tax=Halosquirtibacter xylanolyticus TaxID=3374599 RepID=UPI00374A23F7|nr:DUF6427 family protein [Prolixibacteraceae bacterium]